MGRYISTSEMTTHIAKGILLYARVMNLRTIEVANSPAVPEWESWKKEFPDWVDFVAKQQYDLFDRISEYRTDR